MTFWDENQTLLGEKRERIDQLVLFVHTNRDKVLPPFMHQGMEGEIES